MAGFFTARQFAFGARALFAFLLTILSDGLAIANEKLTVATIEVPPFVLRHPDTRKVTGAAIQNVQAQAKACNIELEFIVSPSWARAFNMATSGVVDGVLPTIKSADRETVLLFSAVPAVVNKMSLITHAESGFLHYEGLSMLDGKSLGKLRDGRVTKELDAYLEGGTVNVSSMRSYEVLLNNLLARRLDFIAGGMGVYVEYAKETGVLEQIRVLEPPLAAVPQYLALSKYRLEKLPALEQAYNCIASAVP